MRASPSYLSRGLMCGDLQLRLILSDLGLYEAQSSSVWARVVWMRLTVGSEAEGEDRGGRRYRVG